VPVTRGRPRPNRNVARGEATRGQLIAVATRLFAERGYEDTSIEAVLREAAVSRGSLYHHFASKEALGYAIVEEKIAKLTRDRWLRPMLNDGEAIDILIRVVQRMPARPRDVRAGCPLLLLATEMSPLDEQFRKRLERIFRDWEKGVAALLRKGQSQGTVRRDLNPDQTASFLIATVEGYSTLAKNAQDAKVWKGGIRNIVSWLESLRATRQSRRGMPAFDHPS